MLTLKKVEHNSPVLKYGLNIAVLLQRVQYGKEEELTVEKYDKHYTYLGDQR